MFEAKEIVPQNPDWIVLVFFVVFAILTFLKISFNDRLYHTSNLFFSKKHLSIYFNKEKKSILRENKKDIKFAENKGLKENLINRLCIDEIKLKSISNWISITKRIIMSS